RDINGQSGVRVKNIVRSKNFFEVWRFHHDRIGTHRQVRHRVKTRFVGRNGPGKIRGRIRNSNAGIWNCSTGRIGYRSRDTAKVRLTENRCREHNNYEKGAEQVRDHTSISRIPTFALHFSNPPSFIAATSVTTDVLPAGFEGRPI